MCGKGWVMGNGEKGCLLLKYCVLCFGGNPVLIHHSPQLQLVIRGQKNLKKRGVSRTHQVSLSVFQALSPVPAGHSGVLGAAQALVSPAWLSDTTQGSVVTEFQSSQPGCSSGHGPGLSATPCLVFWGSCQCLEGFKAFKCTSVNANTPLGALTPLEPLESSSLRLYLFYSCQTLYSQQRKGRNIFLPIRQLIPEAKKAALETCWLLLSSFAGGEMNLSRRH